MMPVAPSSRSEPRSPNGSASPRAAAFDLKGTMAPLTVLRLRSIDLALIERQLRVKIAQLPQLFVDAPVLLDLGALSDEDGQALPLAGLVTTLRSCKLVPVAASNVPEALRPRVADAGLGVLQPTPASRLRDGGAAERGAEPGAEAPAATQGSSARPPGHASHAGHVAHSGPVVVSHPVRSGQVVYAQGNDLVVLAPVNPGAQVIADGHVHVYAPLRGRAVAGAQGLAGARIFCQKLEAELVAVSGAYVMADEIPPERRGKPAQVFLENGECRIAAL